MPSNFGQAHQWCLQVAQNICKPRFPKIGLPLTINHPLMDFPYQAGFDELLHYQLALDLGVVAPLGHVFFVSCWEISCEYPYPRTCQNDPERSFLWLKNTRHGGFCVAELQALRHFAGTSWPFFGSMFCKCYNFGSEHGPSSQRSHPSKDLT